VYESYGNNDDQAEINRCGETWPGRERSHIVFLVQVASPGETRTPGDKPKGREVEVFRPILPVSHSGQMSSNCAWALETSHRSCNEWQNEHDEGVVELSACSTHRLNFNLAHERRINFPPGPRAQSTVKPSIPVPMILSGRILYLVYIPTAR
jgi:hypothetical protein